MSKKSTTDIDREIGLRVRQARLAKGMSQEKLADCLGLTFQQVQKYEKGMNRISASRLLVISELLGCSLLWLYGMDEDKGEVPTPHHQLAEKIARLPYPDQRESILNLVDALLENAPQQPMAAE